MRTRRIRGCWMALSMLALAACAGLPQHVRRIPSKALRDPGSTTLGLIVEHAAADRNLSGIRLLASGDEAFASLLALADRAERTLDIQYYLIHQDDSARLLLHHLRLAADRGVRVRVLIDDLNTAGEDRRFMHLGQHANIEVRVFNPFPGGRSLLWTRIAASMSEIPRINHRMHNKLFVADNALAITGGRNVGDQYFTRDLQSNFIDLDVVAGGSVVTGLSASFDAFWNSKYAYPIASVAAPVREDEAPAPFEENVISGDAAWLGRELDSRVLQLDWVPATVLVDGPAKIALGTPSEEGVTSSIRTLMRSARSELIVISPYFVPGAEGIALLKELVEKGVHIRILTNSLAATDSPLVHNGYSHYRLALLKLGVELEEVRPKLRQKRQRFHPFKSSNASLHAKALVVDQHVVFIGSMNMDARSARTNSELGLVIDSPEIAGQVTSLLDDILADASYTLHLGAHDQIMWSSGDPGAETVWYADPETTRAQRFLWRMLAPFAPEEML